jgi:hypothetical protein
MNAPAMIDHLAWGAEAIRAMVQGLDDDEARWRPPSGGWSALEVVCHLRDEEVEDFRRRLDLALHRPAEDWPPIDPERWAGDRRYNERSLAPETEGFLGERRHSLAWLRRLPAPDWSSAHTHPRLGTMAAGDLLAAWVAHDLLHLRQLARLRYERLQALAAPFQPDYAGRW